jgi:hypothetical protein
MATARISDFCFEIAPSPEQTDSFVVLIKPKGSTEPEDTKKSTVLASQLSGGVYTDDCVCGYWTFAGADTAAALFGKMRAFGMELDVANQDTRIFVASETAGLPKKPCAQGPRV